MSAAKPLAPDLVALTSMKRHYGAGPRWEYAYTYADPVSVGPLPPLVLEVWAPKGRKGGQWVPFIDSVTGAVPRHKTWRKVRRFHQHADKLAHSISAVKPGGYTRSVEQQVETFMAWAKSRGLTHVHAFKGCKVAHATRARAFGLELVTVDPAEFIGDAPAPEECEA